MIPRTPSWRWDADTQTLTLWGAGIDPGAVTVTGPMAALLVDVLSWVIEQGMRGARITDPDPEPEGPQPHVLLEAARTLESVAEDLREEADR